MIETTTRSLQRIVAACAFVGLGVSPFEVKAMVQSFSIDVETRIRGDETTRFQATIIDALHPLEAEEEPAAMTEIEWPLINPDENPGWQMARSAVRLEWLVTSAFGGIQIYTDNLNVDANPRFVDPTPDDRHNPDSNPAGLVLVHPQGERSRETLPMGWSIKPNRRALDEDIQAGDPDKGPAQGPGNRYQWFYIVDLNTPAIDLDGIDADGDGIRWNDPDDGREFTNGDSYITVANHRGIHGSKGPEDFFVDEDRVSYIYFMANFSGAAVQDQYRTNRLILEAFYE